MTNPTTVTNTIQSGGLDAVFSELYGSDAVTQQRERYIGLISQYESLFPNTELSIFSAPGRTELGGNHTDHNHGRVLAAGIQLDKVAAVSPRDDNRVVLWTEGFDDPIDITIADLAKVDAEVGKAEALVRGVAARMESLGKKTGGFSGYIISDVAPGSGLSSSASFEVLVGTIFDHLYNDGSTEPVVLAQAGQFAENEYFEKPCGLMDQTACAVGGIMSIDFANPETPVIDNVHFDFADEGYDLVVVDTGGNHADLTPDYAAVPHEMKSLANALGKSVCRELSFEDVLGHINRLREDIGDRAILRGFHFLRENERVVDQIAALRGGKLDTYLTLVNDSGDSSWKLLQNVYSSIAPNEQGVTLALAISAEILSGDGACRVHGGGFAGTVQVYVPSDLYDEFAEAMQKVFGEGSVTRLRVRQKGLCRIV